VLYQSNCIKVLLISHWTEVINQNRSW